MIIIKCCLLVAVLLFAIYRFGVFISFFVKNKNKLYNFLLGFIALWGINQVLLTPCIISHTNFMIPYYITLSVDAIIIIASFFVKTKQKSIKFDNKYLTIIMCIVILFQIILTTISYTENADDSFYVSLSTISVDSNAIYNEEPSKGVTKEGISIQATEQIPSHELQISIMSKLFDVNSAIICHTLLPMVFIFISYIAYYYFARVFCNQKYAKIFLIILAIILCFTVYTTKFRAGCLLIKPWQGKAVYLNICLTMLLTVLMKNDRRNLKENILLLFIINLASLSLTSTAIFLNAMIYLPFGILKLIKLKWKDIMYMCISFLPVVIYTAILIVLDKLTVNGINSPTSNVDLKEAFLLFGNNAYLVYYFISTFVILLLGSKKSRKYFIIIQIINLLTIWNPLFSNFIARYLTSSATFWRVFWLLPIEMTIAYSIVLLLKRIKIRFIQAAILCVSIVALVVPGKFAYNFTISENLYGIPNYIVKHTNYILEQDKDKDEIMVLASEATLHSMTMRQISSKIKLIHSRYMYDSNAMIDAQTVAERRNLEDNLLGNFQIDIDKFNSLLEKYNVDWIIAPQDKTEVIEFLEDCILKEDTQIDGYILYRKK